MVGNSRLFTAHSSLIWPVAIDLLFTFGIKQAELTTLILGTSSI
jgi:hypothetical protein